ncbi:MAG: type II secretion system protein [Candidatus Omnitrophica bacterium]|nr:type II secretion system protein [Candidatus Omnitrophota bacterium]
MKHKAFTLTEIMLVMIVIALMAAWGLPQYGRTIARARARNALNNLVMIHAANLLYQARHGGSNCPCANITAINDMNGTDSLNIVAGGVTYACNGADCTGVVNGSFTATVNLNSPISDTNPSCANDGTAKICP